MATAGLYNEGLLAEAYAQMQSKRTALGFGADSNTMFGGNGYVYGVELGAWSDGPGLYGYELGAARGAGNFASKRNGHYATVTTMFSNDTDGATSFRMTDGDFIGGGVKYLYLADGTTVSSGLNSCYRIDTDVLGGSGEALTARVFHSSFDSGSGLVGPRFSNNLGSTRSSGTVSEQATNTGSVGDLLVAEHSVPADAAYDSIGQYVSLRYSGGIKGPFNGMYVDVVRTNVTTGVRIAPLYFQGGQSSKQAALDLKAMNQDALVAWIQAATYGLDSDARFVFMQGHMQNDFGDTSASWNPSTEAFDAAATNTATGHANNIRGILHYLRAGMTAAGKDPDSLIFVHGPAHSRPTSVTVNWDGSSGVVYNTAMSEAYQAVAALNNSQIAVIDASVWVPWSASATGDELATADGDDANLAHLAATGYEKHGRRVMAALAAAVGGITILSQLNTLEESMLVPLECTVTSATVAENKIILNAVGGVIKEGMTLAVTAGGGKGEVTTVTSYDEPTKTVITDDNLLGIDNTSEITFGFPVTSKRAIR